MPRSDTFTVSVKKTVQEQPYEPYTVEITVHRVLEDDEDIRKLHRNLAEEVEACLSDRRRMLKEAQAEERRSRRTRRDEV